MQISFRSEKNLGSAYHLLERLCLEGGDSLLLSSGYLSAAHELPLNQLLNGCGQVTLVVGHWSGSTLLEMQAKLQSFADHVSAQSDEYGIRRPTIIGYLVPHWHAKVAIKYRAQGSQVCAALIGSSNISEPALALAPQVFNIECDALLHEGDGPEAKLELNLLLSQVQSFLAPLPGVAL